MTAVVVVGTQWGDEGKGKITDFLSKKADAIARFAGGDNAGHTIKIGEETYKLHLIPSGIFYSDKVSVIGNGVVVFYGLLTVERLFVCLADLELQIVLGIRFIEWISGVGIKMILEFNLIAVYDLVILGIRIRYRR